MKEKVTVVIDSREDEDVAADLAARFNAHREVEDWRIEQLDAGDLDIHGVGFERKTISDYVSSLLEQRLKEQAEKLKQHYEHAYVLVENDLASTDDPFEAANSNISPTAVRGSMASLTARDGLPVIPCSNRSLLADMAVRLARKHIEESDDHYLPKGAVTGVDEPTAKMMYGCIPGVGPDTADTLYSAYPTIAKFMSNADIDQLQELDGIGEKTAKQIMEGFL